MEEKKYIKLTDSDILSAPDPNVPGIEEEFVYKMAHNFRVDITEKQDDLIMSAIKHIGGDIYHRITIDKNKVLDALGKYVAKKVVSKFAYEKRLALTYYHCPTCGFEILAIHDKFAQTYGTDEYSKQMVHNATKHYNYCRECGQHIDWSSIVKATDEEESAMIEFVKKGPERRDRTAPYEVKLDKEYTVLTFIQTVLRERKKDWGYIGIKSSEPDGLFFGKPRCEYRDGEVVGGVERLPIIFLKLLTAKVKNVAADGGLSRMDYLLEVE